MTDIFAECSINYDPKSETTQLFYANMQDKFHFAVTGHTPATINIKYFYRVKTRESIDEEIELFSIREDQYPVNNWLNDIFGARVVVSADEIKSFMDLLDDWQDELNLKNWYFRNKEGYRGLHVYFKNKSNFYFPWELQIWDITDMQNNIQNHEKFKRNLL